RRASARARARTRLRRGPIHPVRGLLATAAMPYPNSMAPRSRPLSLALCALLATGCAARVVGFGDGGPGDGRGDGSSVDPNDDGGTDVRYRDVPVTYDVYREDACAPESGDAVRMYDCDPFDQAHSGCADGEACYPYIDYPSGTCGH